MNGWRYEWVRALPREVYDTLVALLNREHQDHDPDDPAAWLAQLEDDQ